MPETFSLKTLVQPAALSGLSRSGVCNDEEEHAACEGGQQHRINPVVPQNRLGHFHLLLRPTFVGRPTLGNSMLYPASLAA